MHSSELKARFWAKVKISDGCWEWTANRLPAGYGMIKVGGVPRGAHRVSWELAYGPIPSKRQVNHRCDNPPCVRPDHLFVGSQSDNLKDMVRKGRGLTAEQQAAIKHPTGDSHWSRQHPELVKRGAAHGMSKLDEHKVREIRRLHAEGLTDIALGEQFGVAEGTIHFVVRRLTWRHIE